MAFTLDEFKASEHASRPFCLLFGHPVGHSLSPVMHNRASSYYELNLTYQAVDVPPGQLQSLPPLMNDEKFVGANVTIPYKQQLIPFVDQVSDAVQKIGALNTIYKEDGYLRGENTDVYGFSKPLQSYEDLLAGERALIFGSGGASRAIVYALGEMGMEELVLVSRKPGRIQHEQWPYKVTLANYESWAAYGEDAALIVNATPLGMSPDTEASPVRESEQQILDGKICYDIVYRPRITRFLTMAEESGATVIDGLNMLIYQGSRSFEYWTGRTFPIDEVKKAIDDVL